MLTWCRLINWNKVTLIVQRAIKYANESRYSVTTISSFYHKKLEQLFFLIISLINIFIEHHLFAIRNLLFFPYDDDFIHDN